MFLAVMNPHDKSVSIIAVNRNAMALVDVYDEDGVYMGQYTKQITLQHGYGDGMELSCERVWRQCRDFLQSSDQRLCGDQHGSYPGFKRRGWRCAGDSF